MSNAIATTPFRYLDRGWRLLGTALSFVGFGVGALFGLVTVSVLNLLIRDKQRLHTLTRRIVHHAYGWHVELMRLVGVLTYEVTGCEKVNSSGGCLIVANHPSLIDVVFLLSTFRDANCVVKGSFWRHPLTRGTVTAADYIPNDDPVQVMEECIRRLRQGEQILMFPEGTRTRPGQRPQFGRAAATIALRAGVAIQPVRISCTPTTLTKSEPWYRIPSKRVRFEAEVLMPLNPQTMLDAGVSERQLSVNLTNELLRLLGATVSIEPEAQACSLSGVVN